MENLFEKGCLVQLSASVWGAARKIQPAQLTDRIAKPEWLTASKKLVEPDALKPIKRVVNASRSYLAAASLPFPIQGMAFMPKEMINRVDDKLSEFKSQFNQCVDGFIADYEQLRAAASVHLGSLFNETDYPVDVAGKFSFCWRFVVLDVPNGNTAILAPKVYQREKEKFVQTMEQARQMAVESLRSEFAGLIERITDRFATGPDGKPKVFKNSTVENFYEFFETFKERNLFRDTELAELVERAQAILGNRLANTIRSNAQLKQQIARDMQQVEVAMADVLTRPRRKIVLN